MNYYLKKHHWVFPITHQGTFYSESDTLEYKKQKYSRLHFQYYKTDTKKQISNNIIMDKVNNGFGPVHEERRKRPIKICCGIFLSIFVVFNHDFENINIYLSCVSGAMFGEFLRRIFLFAEEYRHAETRYKAATLEHLYLVSACMYSSANKQILLRNSPKIAADIQHRYMLMFLIS